MFSNIENKSVSQIIIEQIQNMIINGTLKSGDKLPPERQLTEELGVGRPALREALKALEVIGLIERRHGQGNFITNNIENSFYKPLSLSFKLNNGSIEELFGFRELLEKYTAKQASLRVTQEDIEKLLEIHNQMINEPDNDKKAEYDKAFHYYIAKISGNKLIISIIGSISYLMDILIDKSVYISLYTDYSIDNLYSEHMKIIEAIRSNNQEAAMQAMSNHLNNINITLIKEVT